MAERSKALSSGFSRNLAVRKGVGSNPTLVINFCFYFPVGIHFAGDGSAGIIVGVLCFVCACETWGESTDCFCFPRSKLGGKLCLVGYRGRTDKILVLPGWRSWVLFLTRSP